MLLDWSEPKGRELGTTIYSGVGENIFRKNRRFVIVWTSGGHSDCMYVAIHLYLPTDRGCGPLADRARFINTYGGRGCKKPGTNNEVHGIIYSQGEEPQLLQGEARLGVDHVCMVPDNRTEKLDPASRINYSKVYPIEHNFPVKLIGRVLDSDLVKMREAIETIRHEAYATTGQSQHM